MTGARRRIAQTEETPVEPVKEKTMEQRTRDRASKAAALFLWAVVIAALGYGVVRTAVQAAALFTG